MPTLTTPSSGGAPLVIGRYAIYDAIAAGGMATVHLGRLIGQVGFQRTVAIKRLHAHFATDADFCAMFIDEARLASRIQHPNVVSTLDVVVHENELLLVMEYVRGETLSRLIRGAKEVGERCPPSIAVSILVHTLQGLHAAHEAIDERGRSLALVHRDVSPQNVLVGNDGVSRVLDFGVAKAEGRIHTTRDGNIKGKLIYMAPEQLSAEELTRRTDLYAVGVVLFEVLTGIRMFVGENESTALTKIMNHEIRVPSEVDPALAKFDHVVRRATAQSPADRYANAQEMIDALETCAPPASNAVVGAWVQRLASAQLMQRARLVSRVEQETATATSEPPVDMPTGPRSSSAVLRPLTAPTALQLAAAQAAGSGIHDHIPVEVETRAVTGLSKSLSVSEVQPPPPRRSRALYVAVPVLAAAVAAYAFMKVESRPSAAAVPPPQAPTATLSAPPVVVAEPPATSTSTVVATPPPVPVPSPAASAAASASLSAVPARTKPVPVPPVRHAAVNCDPPWTIDASGRRHFIPECVK